MPDTAQPATDGFPKSEWTPPDTGVQLAPGGLAAAQAAGYAPAASAPQPVSAPVEAPAPAAPKPKARFAGGGHTRTVPLAFPVEFDGRTFSSVTVRRLTVADFRAYFDRDPAERGRLPAFVDQAGQPMPDEVLDALDFDDSTAVMEALDLFTPAVLKADRAPVPSSAPQPGEGSPRP